MAASISRAETPMKIPPYLKVVPKGIILNLHVQPRSSRTAFSGLYGSSLKLKVQSPPVDGAANRACRHFLAELFRVSKSSVVLESGANSREKAFLIAGISLNYALARLPK
jgi:uncharacterized protein (TIGR00251 family)